MLIKALVVDDDPMIAASLKRVLSYEGFDVRTENEGAAAIRTFELFKPDVVLLDMVMPGLSGVEVCRALRRHSPTPILFLSARDDVCDRVAGLDCGGDDYLVKPFAYEELLARVRALLRRTEGFKSPCLQFADLRIETETRQALRAERPLELSSTEYHLLQYFITNPHRVLTRNMILESVWGYDFEGESNVVEVYVSYLRAKLESGGESRLIHTIRGAGYILKEV